jgi:CHRD domain
MRRRALAAAVTVVLVFALAALVAPGAAASGGRATVLAASLSGAQEVPGPGDPDGSGRALVRLSGDQACFLLTWSRITAPVAAHIHVGRRGVRGAVVVPFFQDQLPDTLNAVAGCAPAAPAVVDAIVADPRGYYVNIHTTEFPDGAIRGQLHRADDVDLDLPDQLTARLSGANEVPPADPDGRGRAFVDTGRTRVCFALLWTNIGAPIFAHIHSGVAGVNGPIVVLFFDVPEAAGSPPATLPDTITAAGGCVGGQSAALLRDIRRHPSAYYVNIHTTEFPGGAIRGQLRRLDH